MSDPAEPRKRGTRHHHNSSRVQYLGEVTGDNMAVTPGQLLDMIRRSFDEPGHPVKGVYAIVVREADDGTLHLDHFRCQLPKFVEVAAVTRAWLRLVSDHE